jgi:hypothetical protein
LRNTDAGGADITIPTQATQSWLDNTEIMIEQAGAGQVRILNAVGVTINRPSDTNNRTRVQYSVVALKRVASDTWTLFGDLAAL